VKTISRYVVLAFTALLFQGAAVAGRPDTGATTVSGAVALSAVGGASKKAQVAAADQGGEQRFTKWQPIYDWSGDTWLGILFIGFLLLLTLLYPVWVWRSGNWFFRACLVGLPVSWVLGLENWRALCLFGFALPAVLYIVSFFIPVVYVINRYDSRS